MRSDLKNLDSYRPHLPYYGLRQRALQRTLRIEYTTVCVKAVIPRGRGGPVMKIIISTFLLVLCVVVMRNVAMRCGHHAMHITLKWHLHSHLRFCALALPPPLLLLPALLFGPVGRMPWVPGLCACAARTRAKVRQRLRQRPRQRLREQWLSHTPGSRDTG